MPRQIIPRWPAESFQLVEAGFAESIADWVFSDEGDVRRDAIRADAEAHSGATGDVRGLGAGRRGYGLSANRLLQAFERS